MIDAAEFEKRKNAQSTTPNSERQRCPEFGTFNIARKVGDTDLPHRQDGDWRCGTCHCHFDEPESPPA